MKGMKISSLLVLIFLTTRCNSIADDKIECKQKLEIELQVKIPNDFEVINKESSSAIGDYTEDFTISFSKKNYDSILKTMDTSTLIRIPNQNWYSIKKINKENDFISITLDSDKSEISYCKVNE
jgi:hypothetical protein